MGTTSECGPALFRLLTVWDAPSSVYEISMMDKAFKNIWRCRHHNSRRTFMCRLFRIPDRLGKINQFERLETYHVVYIIKIINE